MVFIVDILYLMINREEKREKEKEKEKKKKKKIGSFFLIECVIFSVGVMLIFFV